MKTLSKDMCRDMLKNWGDWSRDDIPDYAETFYYTMSPDFRAILKQRATPFYDGDAAMIVEEVMREMFNRKSLSGRFMYRDERWILIEYYHKNRTQKDIAKDLGINHRRVSDHRLPVAENVFARIWAEMAVKGFTLWWR